MTVTKMKYFKIFALMLLALMSGYAIKYFYLNDIFQSINKTKLSFDRNVYNFGNFKFGENAEVYFKYKNNGKKPLTIKDIQSSCGCTIAKWNREPLIPGDIDSILIKYDSENEGFFTKEIIVLSNSETSPDHIFIKGTVLLNEE